MSRPHSEATNTARIASNDTTEHRPVGPQPGQAGACLFLFDCGVWRVAAELKEETTNGARDAEAPRMLPGYERVRINGQRPLARLRGGLSAWQQRKIADYIEEHLAEALRLATLAGVVDLSPYHFARAFRQSFGLPPHRYHNGRRIERAKTLLAEADRSVTQIARELGFAETSSFSAAFRKSTGATPRDFRRGVS